MSLFHLSDKAKKIFLTQVIVIVMLASQYSCKRPSEIGNNRQQIRLDTGWKFSKGTLAEDLFTWETDDNQWELVMLPHTPIIEPLVVNDQWQGIAWYRKHFILQNANSGKKIFLKFEGAMQVADVWINEIHKISHHGGYLPFIIDITDNVNKGDNLIAVKLNNLDNSQVPPGKPLDSLDFNTYGGLYRNVELIITNKVYITDPLLTNETATGGILISFDSISDTDAILNIKTTIKNEYTDNAESYIHFTLIDKDGDIIASVRTNTIRLKPGQHAKLVQKMELSDPHLWHPADPYLYILKTVLFNKNLETDVVETRIGIRDIELRPDGFYINQEKFFINGTNRHQEYPYIGYALSDEAQYRDAVKIKNAGFDLVRFSHYPQSESFLDACDELGLLVMNCIPGWQFMGDETFRENSLDDCRNLIRRDRNHPSVVFWELSLNETPMDENYINTANRILDEEFKGVAYSAGWIDFPTYDLFIPARQHAVSPDYWNNYRVGEKPVFIAEYGDWEYYAQNAGFTQSSFNDLKPEERTSRQFRGDGEKRLLQQALNFQEAINSNVRGKSTIGQANWLMFDYNRGYADDIEASGICDIFRIPKFSYYLFKSQRPPVNVNIKGIESGPMVYIASYWQPQSSTNIRVFSNCDEVALYLNDKLIERKKHDSDRLSTSMRYPPFTFSIDHFREGTLKAIGYLNGKEITSHSIKTPGNPIAIELSYDLSNKPLSAIGKDYVFVYANVVDEQGTLYPENGITIEFIIEGNAVLIGENPVNTEAGIATILLQTYPKTKDIIITAKAKNLQGGKLTIP